MASTKNRDLLFVSSMRLAADAVPLPRRPLAPLVIKKECVGREVSTTGEREGEGWLYRLVCCSCLWPRVKIKWAVSSAYPLEECFG